MLALPKITRHQRKEIINKVSKYNLSVRTLPSFVDIAKGKKGLSDLNELEIEDLLGREKVARSKFDEKEHQIKNRLNYRGGWFNR